MGHSVNLASFFELTKGVSKPAFDVSFVGSRPTLMITRCKPAFFGKLVLSKFCKNMNSVTSRKSTTRSDVLTKSIFTGSVG